MGRTIAKTSRMKHAVVSKWMVVRIVIWCRKYCPTYGKKCLKEPMSISRKTESFKFPEKSKASTKTRCHNALNNYCPYKYLLVFVLDQITGKRVWVRMWSSAGCLITQNVKYNVILIYVFCFVDRASRYIRVKETNLMWYLSTVYFVNRPLRVLGEFMAHQQEVHRIYTTDTYCSF